METMRERYGIIARTLDHSPNVPTEIMENTPEDK